MYSDYINDVRNQLFTNDDYAQSVATFGMNYSLLEALWTDMEELGNIDIFCKKFSKYYGLYLK